MGFLEFDYSEDAQGVGVFDAMASVRSGQVAAARAEVAQVLDWAHAAFPGLRAALDEGGEWDFDLHEAQDQVSPTWSLTWHVLTLSISGGPQFCAAFRQRFGTC